MRKLRLRSTTTLPPSTGLTGGKAETRVQISFLGPFCSTSPAEAGPGHNSLPSQQGERLTLRKEASSERTAFKLVFLFTFFFFPLFYFYETFP